MDKATRKQFLLAQSPGCGACWASRVRGALDEACGRARRAPHAQVLLSYALIAPRVILDGRFQKLFYVVEHTYPLDFVPGMQK